MVSLFQFQVEALKGGGRKKKKRKLQDAAEDHRQERSVVQREPNPVPKAQSEERKEKKEAQDEAFQPLKRSYPVRTSKRVKMAVSRT